MLGIVLLLASEPVSAQWFKTKSQGSGLYTEDVSYELQRQKRRLTRPLNFGFYLSVLRSNFRAQMTDAFAQQPDPTGIISINPEAAPGFGVGFYANVRLGEFWDFRLNTQANFFERRLQYIYANGDSETKTVEGSTFEIPLLLKYRAQLRGIKGMYMVAGVKPSFALSQRKEDEENVLITGSDLSVEYGLGFDVFFPYFKFAPELRFSHGIHNVLDKNEINDFNRPLRRLSNHTVTLLLHFGG